MLVKDSKQTDADLLELVEDTATQLAEEFGERIDLAVIRRTVEEVLESLRSSSVPDFVPLFVHRTARERLIALEHSAAQA